MSFFFFSIITDLQNGTPVTDEHVKIPGEVAQNWQTRLYPIIADLEVPANGSALKVRYFSNLPNNASQTFQLNSIVIIKRPHGRAQSLYLLDKNGPQLSL